MSGDLPYRAEYDKSGYALCNGCGICIKKEILRLGVCVQSLTHDGKIHNWYHFECFFGHQRPKTVEDISHFQSLRWEDQEKIEAKIVLATAESGMKDFTIDYAKSDLFTCKGCKEKILKDEVCISKKDFESEKAKMYGVRERWHHVECFAKLRDGLEFWESGDCLPGIKSLKKEDQQLVKEKLPEVERKEKPADEADGPTPSKKMKTDDEAAIKNQYGLMYKYRDQLKNVLKMKDLKYLLQYNDQDIPSGKEKMLDCLCDIMTFGALERCDECKAGQFVFRSFVGYQCQGKRTEGTKCPNVTLQPKRKPFRVPPELSSAHEFLQVPSHLHKRLYREKYKYVSRKSDINLHAPSTSTHGNSSSSVPEVQTTGSPLKNMEFVILGKTTRPEDEIKKEIKKLGGKVVTNIHDRLAAVISTPDELQKMGKKMEEVKTCDIQVLLEDFLDEAQNGDVMTLITKKNISSWGSDPCKRIAEDAVDSSKKLESKSMFTKRMPSKKKLQLKGYGVVDPDSNLGDVAHVYKNEHDIYNAVLIRTDIQSDKNSHYRLQVLESDDGNGYWLFRSWGRIGTTIGDNRLEEKDSLQDALQKFRDLYEKKTGNMWSNRTNFQQASGRYFAIDLDYNQQDEEEALLDAANSSISCKLEVPVQKLIKLILDVKLMKQVMLKFELDLKKMPLGILSKKQIQQAYSVLSDLQKLVKSDGPDSPFLDAASNRFYTLVPHDFGIKKPPVLNSEKKIKQKLEMLESLMEIEIAFSILKTKSDTEGEVQRLDAHYAKLNTDIEVLDKQTDEFKLLQQYVKNTHSTMHNQYDLEILEVFKVKRNGEEKRYEPFRKLHNRKLLWHGSRLTNFAGILSKGLRIAPPEAEATGYMFGKGIYFADVVSKCANYCHTTRDNSIGLMLLCEVALGNMHECKAAEYIEKLPKNKHSTKGLGRTEPDPKASVIREDGVEVPAGKLVRTAHKCVVLQHNEYIVYDVAQVNIQYLLEMKFRYK